MIEALNFGSFFMALCISMTLLIMAITGRFPSRQSELARLKDLEVMVRVLQADHVRDAKEIERLRAELVTAAERIHILENQLSQSLPAPLPDDRLLLVVLGSDPALKADLAALREVENECGLTVTRCYPARFARFEATLNRYRAAGKPIQFVHFSVHSTAERPAMLFEEGLISAEQLSGVLNGVEVVMVAGCDSDLIGDLLGIVPNIVTFREPLRHDSAALATKLFWNGIGKGLSARQAYRDARSKLPAEVAEFMELHQ